MSTTSQTINQSLFEEQDQIPTQMGFVPFPTNLTFPSLGCPQSLKAFGAIAPSLSSEAVSTAHLVETLLATTSQKPREDLTSSLGGGGGGGGGGRLLSLNRSSANSW